MSETYKCSLCGEVFEFIRDETWSEEKARAEYELWFPNHKWEDRKVVCDDCWKIVKPMEPVNER